ncbi:MAG: QueG-associated DUF1730 domain-containing protein [Lentisphaeria bacterium]|jgi:epoxyqueuosine reductase
MSLTPDLPTWLATLARQTGALAAGVVTPESFAAAARPALPARFAAWLERNAGALGYLDRSLAARQDPFAARPWAKCAIVIAFAGDWGNRHRRPELPPPPPGRPAGFLSLYACGPDYHRTGRQILARAAAALAAEFAPAQAEPGLDTHPVPDTALALAAGLGERGRNGLLRTPRHGSRAFIGTLFSALALPPTKPAPAGALPPCATCNACVQHCPTGALPADGGPLDVRRCRSYLSMERRGPLGGEEQRWLGDALFGCDGCTAGCPPALAPEERLAVDPAWLLETPPAELRRRLAGTALEHAGTTLLRRNAAAVLLNALPPGPERDAWRQRLLADPSPTLRGTAAAAWKCKPWTNSTP